MSYQTLKIHLKLPVSQNPIVSGYSASGIGGNYVRCMGLHPTDRNKSLLLDFDKENSENTVRMGVIDSGEGRYPSLLIWEIWYP